MGANIRLMCAYFACARSISILGTFMNLRTSPREYKVDIHMRRINPLVPFLGGMSGIVFACSYLAHDYNYLISHYLHANGCFYRYQHWQREFFTPQAKVAGNWFCVSGIIVGLALVYQSALQWRHNRSEVPIRLSLNVSDVLAITGLWTIGLAMWVWGFRSSPPAYDEVFSVVNCAGQGPGLSWSYYMIPNNHVLFNVLNSSLFGFMGDKIVSGRIISGLSHMCLIALLCNWLRRKTAHRGYAAIYCLVLILQFPVWGFSFQARGYAIYLLCAWASLIYLEQYIDTKRKEPLILYALAVATGFAVMPNMLTDAY